MNTRKTLNFKIVFVVLVIGMLAASLIAETLYVDNSNGSDTNPGTIQKPLQSLSKAAELVNAKAEAGPTVIKILPGTYQLDKTVVFENSRAFTPKKRLVIEAAVLPDDAEWEPGLMPTLFSSENLYDPQKPNRVTGTYGLRIKVSHVTIRGLKFLGSESPNNMYAPVERIGSDLKDLLVTQCMFVGDKDSLDIYCPVIATGDKLIVDHCIFHGCHASAVFWDGTEGASYKNNAMRYCIVDGGLISGVWTCQTDNDFQFHNNVVTDTEFFWMRKRIDKPKKYKMKDCIINAKNYSSYGVEAGPTGLTGPEVKYNEKNIIKDKPILLVRDKKARNYLHVKTGTLGSKLGAGLFAKSPSVDFGNIYSDASQGKIKKVLEILDSFPSEKLTEKQIEEKERYYKRFREQNEKIEIKTDDPFVRYIIEAYHNYWKKVFLQKSSLEEARKELESEVKDYLFTNDLVGPLASLTYNLVPFDNRIKKILKKKGYYSILGTTRPYRELMIWGEQTERKYMIKLPEGKQKVKVIFMGDFVSRGWLRYATLGKSGAGGWAKKNAIYSLGSYDLSSENFTVSLLVHEGQHLSDYKTFPKLRQEDKEYRAKLAELSKAKKTIYKLLKGFTTNSKYDKKHPHPFANYCLTRDLSRKLFNEEFVSDMKRWEAIPHEKINEASIELLKKNTIELKKAGAKSVTKYIN